MINLSVAISTRLRICGVTVMLLESGCITPRRERLLDDLPGIYLGEIGTKFSISFSDLHLQLRHFFVLALLGGRLLIFLLSDQPHDVLALSTSQGPVNSGSTNHNYIQLSTNKLPMINISLEYSHNNPINIKTFPFPDTWRFIDYHIG